MRRGMVDRLRQGIIGAAFSAAFFVSPAAAQDVRVLTFEEALRLAESTSEDVTIARAGVMRTEGQRLQSRSEFFPQIYGSLGYTRTLASEFSALQDDSGDTGAPATEDCGDFLANPALPLEQRVDSLEAFVECSSTANPFAAFRNLPFGRENQWSLGLTVSQTVFAGGRIWAQTRAADAGMQAAEIALRSARASVLLEVAQAYYDAALADRLLDVAQATLAQAETTLDQVRVGLQVGEQPEFELLRAQVTRDTQTPVVIQRTAVRDLAHLRLRQLLNLPLDAPMELASVVEDIEAGTAVTLATELAGVVPDTAVSVRAPVQQAEQSLRAQEAQIDIAQSERWPALSLTMNWARVGYPTGTFPESWNQFRTNWTVSASVSVPIFTGGRITGAVKMAEAAREEARAQLQKTRELAALDTRDALEQLRAAEATWESSTGTVDQANKAYEIAEIRFREGLSTQLELSDSRILLQQAQANRAQSARDLLVARLRVALLPLLPLGQGSSPQQMQVQQVQVQTPTPGAATTRRTTATQTTNAMRTGGR